MIPLVLRLLDAERSEAPFVARLTTEAGQHQARHALLHSEPDGSFLAEMAGRVMRIAPAPNMGPADLDGDVVIFHPSERRAVRLIRRTANANTILLTEECDQRCVMCSQPPRARRYDSWDLYAQAIELAPANAVIGISGGEPMLLKERLFTWLLHVAERRPDVQYHVLTNGQHFARQDCETLRRLSGRVLWGVPLYSAIAGQHDSIVSKAGAYDRLLASLAVLEAAGSAVELRTVVIRPNLPELPNLAAFVGTHLSWIESWAIMQMERYGYGRMNWASLFADTGASFAPIAAALRIAEVRGVTAYLFNFPLCTVPEDFRELAVPSISDWKQRFLPACAGCRARSRCGGFFEWYRENDGFERISPL